MVWPLFKHELRSCAAPVAVVACVLALYAGAVVGMFDPELGESLETMRGAMPELFAAFGMADQGSTLLEFLVSYLYGFLLVVFPLALAAMLTDRLMVRRIEQGSISYLLAQPVGRARLATSQLLVMTSCLIALMAVMGAVEYACAEALFPGELAAADLLAINVSTLCLWSFLAGICWLSACALPGTAAARWAGAAICIAFVLTEMASGVGEGLAWLGDVTPLALFDPLGVVSGEAGALAGSTILALAGIALASVGTAAFCRRDFSV
ncbi:ABC transporter permease [Collinsella sp. An2]|uniref:ABC transporter permease n=1 Tax=Collinsella sp. An2 TaxID=1965585 RepID=UPI000B397C72|nr:ABC transporter permease [Collinsella sp. An2]OUP09779.1 hypothetical protein B5F33_04115 [Collinsella sp. An2]